MKKWQYKILKPIALAAHWYKNIYNYVCLLEGIIIIETLMFFAVVFGVD